MQALVSQLLIGLITLCPLVCGAEVVVPCDQERHALDHDDSPTQCPDDGDNCICQGAVRADASRLSLSGAIGHPILPAEALTPSSHLVFPPTDCGMASRSGKFGSGANSQAALQNFRC